MKAFIGSAHLTEAAPLRNIEIGLVTANAAITGAVERHIEAPSASPAAVNHATAAPLAFGPAARP
jgi:hypothetical protein